jgi:hypothetical protein
MGNFAIYAKSLVYLPDRRLSVAVYVVAATSETTQDTLFDLHVFTLSNALLFAAITAVLT